VPRDGVGAQRRAEQVRPEGQVAAVDDEAAGDRAGARQLLGEGGGTEPVAEQERRPGGTDAPPSA